MSKIVWDIEKVKQFVKENSGCQLLSDRYTNNKTKLRFLCGCGNEFQTTFKEFKGRKDRSQCKRQCNKCGRAINTKKRTKSHDEFKEEVYGLVGREYEVIGEYINALTNIKIKHTSCDYVFHMKPNDFLLGQRCPKCYGTFKKTTEEFKKEVDDITNNEYKVLGEYNGNKDKISILHTKCGNTWDITPNSFLRGTRCPKCQSSKGEKRIRLYLEDKNIKFKEEFTISECKNILPLPFDFAIFDNDNKLKLLIEYDGIQHFEPQEHFGGIEKFKIQCKTDNIKRKYCEKNNIRLLEIPYTEFNSIEAILNNKLNISA